jgi:hypothetical protein
MIPLVIKSTDVGAPSLTGQDGSMYTLMKWALPQLGWTQEFDDGVNFKVAFRNNPVKGTGYHIRFRDKAADHAFTAHFCCVDAFETMSDIDTGTKRFPLVDRYWVKSPVTTAVAYPYIFIGTDIFFYFFTYTFDDLASQQHGLLQCAGDYIPVTAMDPAPFYLHSFNATWNAWASYHLGGSSMFSYTGPQPNHAMQCDASLAVDSTGSLFGRGSARVLFNQGRSAIAYIGGTGGPARQVFTNAPLYSRVGLMEVIGEHIRGFFPGLIHSASARLDYANQAIVLGVPDGIGTTTCLFIKHDNQYPLINTSSVNSYGYGGFLFDIGRDWDTWYE